MSKRKFYRNFNKRKKFNGTRVVTVVLCLAIIGTYTYINLKDKNFMDKLGNINMVSSIRKASIWGGLKNIFDKSNVITSSNIESQLKEIENDNKDKKDEEESTKVVSVNEMVIYTIQVASLENESELKKIEEVMNENKIPSSSMSIDNSEKIQIPSGHPIRCGRKSTKSAETSRYCTP